MQHYELTPAAQEDLKEIARYTLTKWGKKQSLHYAELLETQFRKIAAKTAYYRNFSKRFPLIFVSRCEHHYIFYVHSDNNLPRIIAVLHERMEIVARLKNRLE